MIRRRLRAAWRAFRDPSLLEERVVFLPATSPPVEAVAERVTAVATVPQEPAPPVPLRPPATAHGRHVIYHHDPTTTLDTVIYPAWAGQDSGAEARRVFEDFLPQFVGEFIVYEDNGVERGRKP